MSINDLELTGYVRQIKNSITGDPKERGEEGLNLDELAGMAKGRELMRRFKAMEIAAQLAQQRLGELT